jgi:hypothetical protein
MISVVAFACVSSEGVAVSGIEFTPELKASLGLSTLGSMIRKPLDDRAMPRTRTAAAPSSSIFSAYTWLLPALSSRRCRYGEIARWVGSRMS